MNASSYALQLARSITKTMACSLQKHSQPQHTRAPCTTTSSITISSYASSCASNESATKVSGNNRIRYGTNKVPRGSLQETPPLEFQWPPTPVSSHTTHMHLTMMNQDPKDLHTARLIIEELRAKVRYQTEHIMKWRKAYAIQIHQHYRHQKEKTEQLNSLTSQLLLLESRLKRKQKQVASLISHRELTIQRQQKVIDTLSSRLSDHGLETIDSSCTVEMDSLNDSDSAVVLEEIDPDCNATLSFRRRSCNSNVSRNGGITIVRSISDAIETQANKYGGGARRNNCFLRRPEILETVYSVEEDQEPTPDVAEKRDKFKNRSEKALSYNSTEGQIDNTPTLAALDSDLMKKRESQAVVASEMVPLIDNNISTKLVPAEDMSGTSSVYRQTHTVNEIQNNAQALTPELPSTSAPSQESVIYGTPYCKSSQQVTNYNRVMSNHRSVTKPKDVKYKRINKAKSKSLEELRGRLKNLVERGSTMDPAMVGAFATNALTQTAQSYA